MGRHRLMAFLCGWLALGAAATAWPEGEDMAERNEVLVGVSYFAGWWEPLPNKWHNSRGEDWRPAYPERTPLLGQYNNQETMNRAIVAAADHGGDFFCILWYPPRGGKEREPNAIHLERGVLDFMASPESHRMKFMVEYCNHPPYDTASDEEWDRLIATWIEFLRHPSYLRLDGRPVFKVHSGHFLLRDCDGDMDKARARLDRFRQAAQEAGVGNPILGAGVGGHEAVGLDHWAAKLFEFTGTYMDLPNLEQTEQDYPWEILAEFTVEGRRKHGSDAIPYMPYVPAGWRPRPWGVPRACFRLPDRSQWHATLEQVKRDLHESATLGLPGHKAFTIYAWNEFGEGGIVAPTQGDKYMKLEVIREMFGANDPAGRAVPGNDDKE